jgi:hypothetical protein
MDLSTAARRFAVHEAIGKQVENLESIIGGLVVIAKTLPEGDSVRNELFDKIGCLDVVATSIREALDCAI